jgi:hypothetical protein
MKNKKKLFLGIALILLALVAGVAFAAVSQKDGVYCLIVEGRSSILGRDQPDHYKYYMELYNSNDYAVIVRIGNAGWNSQSDRYLGAGETKHYPCIQNSYILTVKKR